MHDAARYEATAAVLRSEQVFPSGLRSLAHWVTDAYSTDVVNIVADEVDDGRPWLCLWSRTSAQRQEFRTGGDDDVAKQSVIADRARHELSSSESFLVIFEDFESRARERAMALPSDELDMLRTRLRAGRFPLRPLEQLLHARVPADAARRG
ncbi:hypothetical protein [Microbacterium sp. NPDC056234]|uniref:hypothetical protein n=1 Tax=Microbacterium sp. NPDC056234 TaxID=3345757 RepID=UPI0035D71033